MVFGISRFILLFCHHLTICVCTCAIYCGLKRMCYSLTTGMRKTYWITCNVEPDIQHLSLDRQKFPSNFVVRPRDLNRLLANFQSSIPNFN
ncbi:hypothetical protein Fmac_006957 [Flemingia macrophylla]|uniref:Secreted protein n=1 Tax=Flemingia macrophylla TaxID=520843 RepID=A0ABD1NC27_9FABA